ncbi:interleukin-33 [Nannospalax galili]|uniref:interleukin-33 n=1 Tax=Nannospalax galili TaxID=1026970 RepID=UPI0004ED6C2A|nr:interleukin-33 [Nannospalax galili]XP_008829324.1 interleukin-33 [Nannospalax galili]XP_008829325.1 interleukin-33 [Nannospalax galili]
MKPKMKYSTSKISSAKLINTADKTLAKPCQLRSSQHKTKEICHVYTMRLRSGLIIKKETCYFSKETTKRYSIKNGAKLKERLSGYHQPVLQNSVFDTVYNKSNIQAISLVTESCASLSTYNDQSVSFVLENGDYVINVEDSGKDQEKDKVLLRYHESPYSASESGDGGKLLMVNMSPIKDTNICLHANDKDHSVELQKGESPLPEQAFFVLHKESSDFVSFESKSNRGTYIGVKNNQLALIEGKKMDTESIMFKLSKM